MAVNLSAFAQREVSSTGYLQVVDHNGVFYCVDGVLFLTSERYYSLGNPKRGETLVKFPQNKQLNTYTVPNGVTNIAKGAFQGNNSLRTIRIPSSVYYIGDNAFADCGQLQSIEIYESTNAVKAVENDESHFEAKEVGRYNIQGVKIEEGTDGRVQIILYSDGTSKKVIE